MGRKHIVPYGLYRAHVFISAKLAERTGFAEADLDLLFEALGAMFEHDRSAARGEMASRRALPSSSFSTRQCPRPCAVRSGEGAPKDRGRAYRTRQRSPQQLPAGQAFSDYEITVDRDGLPERSRWSNCSEGRRWPAGCGHRVDDPIPLSALQHAVYCLRQAALIHIERHVGGEPLHRRGARPARRAAQSAAAAARGTVRRVTALPLACRRLNLAGVADMVEFRAGRGRRDRLSGRVQARQAQAAPRRRGATLRAGAVPRGDDRAAGARRRAVLCRDETPRRRCPSTTGCAASPKRPRRSSARCRGWPHAPRDVYRADRCRACSLIEVCRPRVSAKSALGFRERAIDVALQSDERAI